LAVILLVQGGVLWLLQHLLSSDLAALLGALAILLGHIVAGAICLSHLWDQDHPEWVKWPLAQVRRELGSNLVICDAMRGLLLVAAAASGLWIGFISNHPLVVLPVYYLTLTAWNGLTGTLPKRLTPSYLIRVGALVASALLGVSLKVTLAPMQG